MWWVFRVVEAVASESLITSRELGLDEAIQLALEQNPDLKSVSLAQELANIELRRSRMDRFFATVDVGTQWGVGATALPGQPLAGADQFGVNADIRGGWTIFAGGAHRSAISSAEVGEELAKSQIEISTRQLIRGVVLAYWNIQGIQLQIDSAKESLVETQAALTIIEAKEKAGLAASLDVNRSTVALLNEQAGIVSLESELSSAKQDLLRLLQLPNTELNLTDSIDGVSSTFREQDWVAQALERRPELKQQREREEQAEYARKIARSNYYPSISLQGGTGLDTQTPLFATPREFRPTWQADLGIGLSWQPFDLFKTRDEVAKARIHQQKLEYEREALVKTLEAEVRQSISTMYSYIEQNKLLARQLELARDNLQIVQELYAQGSASILDLFDAQTSFRQASSQYAISRVRMVTAEFELRFVSGDEFISEKTP